MYSPEGVRLSLSCIFTLLYLALLIFLSINLLLIVLQAGLAPAGRFSRAALTWAFSVLLSRLVRLAALGDRQALVPWADLLNHSPQASGYLDWDAGQAGVVLALERDYQEGEQVRVVGCEDERVRVRVFMSFTGVGLCKKWGSRCG